MNETKDRILKSALALFAKMGYDATSVSMIAEELGMTKSALYKHYRNKQDVFDCITARMQQDDRNASNRFALEEGAVTIAQLSRFALSQFRYWTSDPFASNFRKLLTVEQYKSEQMQEIYQQYIAGGPLAYVEQIFRDAGKADAAQEALRYFAPMFLCYSLADQGADAGTLCEMLRVHFQSFETQDSNQKQL